MTSSSLPDADLGSIKARIRELRERQHRPGPIAIAARPVWSGPSSIDVNGERVVIGVAPSVLAMRDLVTRRNDADWTVILTDRSSSEIPVGIADHLVTQRLLNLNPFPMLRAAFSAAKQEFGLLGGNNDVARSVLRELPDVVTPARGGVLTESHLFAELAQAKFDLGPADLAPHHVAVWSIDGVKTAKYTAWKALADQNVVAAFNEWLHRRMGDLGPVVAAVFDSVGPDQLVPLGLVAAVVGDPNGIPVEKQSSAVRIEMKIGENSLTGKQLWAWGAVSTAAIATASDSTDLAAALTRAQEWVAVASAEQFVAESDVLPAGLDARIDHFAESLGSGLAAATDAWEVVRQHRDGADGQTDPPRDVRVGRACLRLLRRLEAAWNAPETLSGWLDEYRRDLSWVDGAVDNAYIGADNPKLAAASHALINEVRANRGLLDRQFAGALASAGAHRETTGAAPMYLEDVLDQVVQPLTVPGQGGSFGGAAGLGDGPGKSPVLIIVADGMDVSSANSVVADARRHRRTQWQDCVFTESSGPLTALAVLPTVTKFSRCSLLTGALAAGGQERERSGFSDWLQQNGLRGQRPVLFHKADLEAVSKGHALAADVRSAVQDTKGRPVIACVLNDIDDALDRSDPIGTEWTVSSFKRLEALLTEASAVSRTVVLVSDHGHVVERREQASVQRGEQVSARYRTAVEPIAADEVLVAGPRVLADGNSAVLAVDEQVRYRGLKAGYHGGAALSEAVVAVSILVSGKIPEHLGLMPSPLEPPSWWRFDELSVAGGELRAAAKSEPRVDGPKKAASKNATPKKAEAQESLFDVGSSDGVVDAVSTLLASDLFVAQLKAFGRRKLTAPVIGSVLREAMALNGVLPAVRVAELCGLKATQARSAVSWLAQILNVDGVIAVEQQGEEAVIAVGLLFEQYGVS
ncbi:BREX-2 system phosphatase PglZ [Gordonia sp. MMO-8]|uniref:BREX-2 system phosphatase PglZ n=1 Tax=Gordonia sp. MMO-8 TaxID=3127886 RepID=UPI003019BACD